ncbi:unnamed protein product [Eruca vesicaria subsp. sativa]|uniref:RRM domain-containing protein n=1 Tax=Eruca vesicaria subsp. sativa TaxID=29727 RepID=A0ABC8JAW1_ERUVS|nr:unnamed protein product [Eruca vesicaria subsp. sativa]
MGYNTDLHHDDVERSQMFVSTYLQIIFSTVLVFIYFLGEGTADKALELNGTDMGRWNVIVEPFREDADCVGVASVFLYGEGAEDKLLDLDGSYMGGSKILVKVIPSTGIHTVHPRRRYTAWPR